MSQKKSQNKFQNLQGHTETPPEQIKHVPQQVYGQKEQHQQIINFSQFQKVLLSLNECKDLAVFYQKQIQYNQIVTLPNNVNPDDYLILYNSCDNAQKIYQFKNIIEVDQYYPYSQISQELHNIINAQSFSETDWIKLLDENIKQLSTLYSFQSTKDRSIYCYHRLVLQIIALKQPVIYQQYLYENLESLFNTNMCTYSLQYLNIVIYILLQYNLNQHYNQNTQNSVKSSKQKKQLNSPENNQLQQYNYLISVQKAFQKIYQYTQHVGKKKFTEQQIINFLYTYKLLLTYFKAQQTQFLNQIKDKQIESTIEKIQQIFIASLINSRKLVQHKQFTQFKLVNDMRHSYTDQVFMQFFNKQQYNQQFIQQAFTTLLTEIDTLKIQDFKADAGDYIFEIIHDFSKKVQFKQVSEQFIHVMQNENFKELNLDKLVIEKVKVEMVKAQDKKTKEQNKQSRKKENHQVIQQHNIEDQQSCSLITILLVTLSVYIAIVTLILDKNQQFMFNKFYEDIFINFVDFFSKIITQSNITVRNLLYNIKEK